MARTTAAAAGKSANIPVGVAEGAGGDGGVKGREEKTRGIRGETERADWGRRTREGIGWLAARVFIVVLCLLYDAVKKNERP